jgi:DNA-binding GntR family transcriptional regulator
MDRVAYRRLYNALKAEILDGVYVPGDRVPTELELCEQFSVSRITSRHALRLLQDQGFVTRQAGKGTFVRTNVPRKIPIIDGDYAGSLRYEAPELARRLITNGPVEPPREIAVQLGIEVNEQCWLAERVDLLEDEPIAYDRAFFPTQYAGALSNELLTAIDFFQKWMAQEELVADELRQTIEALTPDERGQQILAVSADQPLLLTTETIRNEKGVSLMVVETYYRGDRIQLIATNDAASILPGRDTKQGVGR